MEITKANPDPTPIQEVEAAVVAVEATISAVPTIAVEAMVMTAVGATETIAAGATTTVEIHTTMTDVLVAETIMAEEEDQLLPTRDGTMLTWEAAAAAAVEAAVTIDVIQRGATNVVSTVK